jgi:PAS domain S-box-containing protein
MSNLFSRVLILVAVTPLPLLLVQVMAASRGQETASLLAVGVAGTVAVALLGAEALVRRPLRKLAARAAALDAAAAADGRREGALRSARADADTARAALAATEVRLRLALAAADVTVFEIDLARDRVWLDHRAASITRGLLPAETWLPRADARLHAWLAGIHPEDAARRRAALRAVIEGREAALSVAYRVRTPDRAGWFRLAERGAVVERARGSGAPLRIVGVVQDVTEEHDRAAALAAEIAARTAELHASDRRFRAIFDAALQIIGVLGRDGTLMQANRAALEFLGCAEADVIGRRIWEIGSWAACPHAVAAIRTQVAAAAAGNLVRAEAQARNAAGRSATFDVSLKPVHDGSGAVAMLIVEARDITERQVLQAQLAQAQKMEAVGQLTGGVAHDFNNLLQALTGNLDLIHRLAEARGDARLLHLITSAQRAAARGARLTQQLLAFSRRQHQRAEPVWVSRLAAGMVELLYRAAGETITVELHAVPDLWPCRIDAAQFESALLNLVINARDAMPDGGSLTVAADNAVLAPAEAAALELAPGAYVRVDVADTGAGIAPEHLPHLFEPFFTTKEPGKGTGLGLAMVHGFARQSGGAVTVASTPGAGTTVSLFLPRVETPAVLRPAGPAAPAAPQAGDGRRPLGILLVEDDEEVREAMQGALAEAGHRVHTAAEGEAALAILANGETLDLLLCDVALPGAMNGLEIAAAARRHRPGLRIVLASGYGADALDASGLGEAFEVLAKPFSQAELLHCVADPSTAAAAAG